MIFVEDHVTDAIESYRKGNSYNLSIEDYNELKKLIKDINKMTTTG